MMPNDHSSAQTQVKVIAFRKITDAATSFDEGIRYLQKLTAAFIYGIKTKNYLYNRL